MKQFAICWGVMVILLLNVMEVYFVCGAVGYTAYGLPENIRVVPVVHLSVPSIGFV